MIIRCDTVSWTAQLEIFVAWKFSDWITKGSSHNSWNLNAGEHFLFLWYSIHFGRCDLYYEMRYLHWQYVNVQPLSLLDATNFIIFLQGSLIYIFHDLNILLAYDTVNIPFRFELNPILLEHLAIIQLEQLSKIPMECIPASIIFLSHLKVNFCSCVNSMALVHSNQLHADVPWSNQPSLQRSMDHLSCLCIPHQDIYYKQTVKGNSNIIYPD